MDEYEVEKIIDKRYINGKLEYKIKWVGYPMSECTWEPVRNLANVKPMIKEFENSSFEMNDKQNKLTDYYLIGKKRENNNDSSFDDEIYQKNEYRNKKPDRKKIFYINDKYKSIYTIKKKILN